MDLQQWLATLDERPRPLTLHLAAEVGKLHRLSRGEISQFRALLAESWREIHGAPPWQVACT